MYSLLFFFFNDTATTEIYTYLHPLSLHAALPIVVAVAVGMLLSHGLKSGFDRPRPDLVPHGTVVVSASFPSGHSMLSAAVYLTLGAVLAREIGRASCRERVCQYV